MRGSRPSVERVDAGGRRAIPIGAFSAMYSGYLRPDDAVALRHLAGDDPAVDGLRTVFAGPDPWNPWWF